MRPVFLLFAVAFALCSAAAEPLLDLYKGPLTHAKLFKPNTDFDYFATTAELEPQPDRSFHIGNAATLAQCNMLIFVRDPSFIERRLNEAGFPYVRFFEAQGAFAFLAADDDRTILTFRGTQAGDWDDYRTNATIGLSPFAGKGRAHSGFAKRVEQLRPGIEQALSELPGGPERRLWISGHSAGGAMAILYGILNHERVEGIYTTGSPRVANGRLAAWADKRLPVYRLVNNNDSVPYLPFPLLYRHVGPNYFIDADGRLIREPNGFHTWKSQGRGHAAYAKALYDRHWARFDFSAIPTAAFTDHSPLLYTLAALSWLDSDSEL